jgi:hypothetical protein
MKKSIIILIISAILLISCGEKVKRHYYKSGELHAEEIFISDSTFYFKAYYKNGKIAQEGIVKYDSISDGHWKLYYADGQLWWEGEMKNSVIQDSCKWKWDECVANRLKGIEIEGNPKELVVGETYRFRVIMPEMHPKFYLVVDSHYKNIEAPDDIFPFVFECTLENDNLFRLMFMDKNGRFKIGSAEYVFYITPSKEKKITNPEEMEVGDTICIALERKFSDGTTDTIIVYR